MRQNEALLSLGALAAVIGVVVLTQHGGGGGTSPAQGIKPPTGLAATAVSSTGFTLTWMASAGAVGYLPSVDGGAVTDGPVNQLSLSFEHLTPGSTLACSVVAVAQNGTQSAPSAVLSVPLPTH